MTTRWTIGAAFAGLSLAALLPAQQGGAEQERAQDQKQEPKAEGAQEPQAKTSIAEAIRDLGSDSYKKRLEAERRLRAAGKEAVQDLQRAAANDTDPEAQWRARRLLRQIERGEHGGLGAQDRNGEQRRGGLGERRFGQPMQPGQPGQQGQGGRWRAFGFPDDDVQRRFDELFQQLERDFGMDIPRGNFFRDDFFQDLRAQVDAMRQQLQQGAQGGQNQSMSMRMGPDGVRVEVKTKNEKGEEETKVYEAPDLETFRRQHPGVLEQSGLGLGGGLRFFLGDGTQGFGQRGFDFGRTFDWNRDLGRAFGQGQGGRTWTFPGAGQDGDLDAGADAQIAVPPADRRLGIVVRPEISPEVREALGLEDGRGLMVDDVQPDTLAASMGLERGDVLLEVAGRTIRAASDVQEAVGGVETGKTVEVKFLRKGKERTASAEKTARPEAKDGAKADAKAESKADAKLAPRTSK